jgi:hypothetical protein
MPQPLADLISAWDATYRNTGRHDLIRSGGVCARGPSGHTMLELYELQLEEMKHNIKALERIAQALERRDG